MIVNNSRELVICLQFLIPNCSCTVWETLDPRQYQGENSPIVLCNMMVDWREKIPCPTDIDIEQINEIDLNEFIGTKRKEERDEKFRKDLTMIACYSTAKEKNPDL